MTKQPEPLVGVAIDALNIVVERVGHDKQAFIDSDLLQDATLMRIQEAGECLSRIRDGFPDFYEKNHVTAWNDLIGLRNIISHGYLQVDKDKVWEIVQHDIPELIIELNKLI
jgi:uncharacterized protein with HEPN domain